MSDPAIKSFDTLVSDQATAVQGSATGLVDFSVGSILRAFAEAIAGVGMWLQGLILKLLAATRASTSTGVDLDTWFADFGFARLGASAATGQATFSRFTPTFQAVVSIGTVVQTGDGSQQYTVVVDTTNPAYNAGLGGYVVGAGVASVSVPIAAVTAGSSANADVGGVNTLGQAIAGIDRVTNQSALTNGVNSETDAAARARFVRYIASLSKATRGAVTFAVASVQANASCTLTEDLDYSGSAHLGYFYVVADDGSGSPSTDFLNRVYAAVDLVRPVGTSFAVFPPVVVSAGVVAAIRVGSGYAAAALVTAVQTAIIGYVNALPLGAPLLWSRLIQIAYDASPGVVSVSNLILNGAAADIVITDKQMIKAGTVAIATVA